MTKDSKNELVFLPLGGVGEIGMNMALYGFGPPTSRKWIIVDCGVTFPGPDLPGVDLVLPDIRFLEGERANILGMVITHAHEDHYGAVMDLWPRLRIPVHVTPFCAGLLEAKRFFEEGVEKIPLTIYKVGDRFNIGPFEIEAINVTHSIPEPVALAIRTPLGNIVHTGDWKLDDTPSMGLPTDEKRFKEIGAEGVLALMCDSTNALREGDSPSEKAVGENLTKIISGAKGRVAVTSFSSNVGRIRTVMLAARDAGRSVIVLGRSMKRMLEVSAELGYMEGMPEILAEEDFASLPRQNCVVILTGSQGESRAALAKLANDEMRSIKFVPGDCVIFSSRTIPGNEKAIIDIKNKLIDQGIEIISDEQQLVHVSGHPRRNELKKMYAWVKPQILVPVHGEAAHLTAQAALGANEGIGQVARVRNGDMLRLAPGRAEVIDDAPSGRIYKDGKLIGDFDEMGIGDRRKLAFAGHVGLSVTVDEKYNIAGDPDLESFGLPELDADGEDMDDQLFDAAMSAFDSIPRAKRRDLELVREAMRRAVRSAAEAAWGKKPIVTVFVTQV
jgi:ribonuclease J